jgi:hypothetical protein
VVTWSPDSRYIAFNAGDDKLKKAAVTGGPAQVISCWTGATATWGVSDAILADPGPDGALWRVPGSGGQPVAATELDVAQKKRLHRYPFFLPDGRHFSYLAGSGGAAQGGVACVGSLDSKDSKPSPGITSEAKYADGYVLFIREGALMAQPFDLKQLEFSGEPFLLSNRSRQKMLAPAQIRLGLDQELLIRVVRAANQEFACRRHRPCAFLHQVAAIVRVCEMEQDIPGGLPAGDHPHRRSPPFR